MPFSAFNNCTVSAKSDLQLVFNAGTSVQQKLVICLFPMGSGKFESVADLK
jgi:hypothetical protein